MGLMLARLGLGLACFLAGMSLLRHGLIHATSRRVKRLLARFASPPFAGAITGTFVTALIQSSSAVTVLVVGLVDAGILDLYQAFGIIIGANVGTTITAQLIAFDVAQLALPCVVLGATFILAACILRVLPLPGLDRACRASPELAGEIILGLGLLFGGMNIMTEAVGVVRDDPRLTGYLVAFGQSAFWGTVAGVIFTGIIQSSSATTAIVLAFARQGLLPLEGSMGLILGSNIGTCVTALLASLGTGATARKAALAHLMFNVFGVAIIFPFISQFGILVSLTSGDLPRQVANAHALFNLISAAIVLPWARRFVDIISLISGERG
ncbi:MAG TPA: Na/Pi cotransporter family protein [Firmicutes bacterium]|nr:Na/Pi cotransporter family protein [Bacillota bacterium]